MIDLESRISCGGAGHERGEKAVAVAVAVARRRGGAAAAAAGGLCTESEIN